MFDGSHSAFQVMPQREIIPLVMCLDLCELSFIERFLRVSVDFHINGCCGYASAYGLTFHRIAS